MVPLKDAMRSDSWAALVASYIRNTSLPACVLNEENAILTTLIDRVSILHVQRILLE